MLGIDPGTAIVGWGILDCTNSGQLTKTVAYGHIETYKDLPTAERLKEIADNLLLLIKKYNPHETAIEELFYFKNAKTVISVAQARGVIINTCFQEDLTIAEYTPLQIKQSLTGYGRADKTQMQKMIKSVLNLKSIPKPDDTADALTVALCHINSRRYIQKINN
ncbi:MAG TPA: crossover junction endodeoxyribonuclease RuvC [Candidatus Pacebacteria bacterium]|nr:crossover junction endodeoxyribonuclease RuvC [Candidatus Paceibacterota bacterium]